MSRYTLYTRLVLIIVVLAMAAWVLGTEPWGPG
jgi:hypothetical protein